MIILDTHVWIWYVSESEKLSQNASFAINNSEVCGVSTISCWEIAMLVEKKRLVLNISVEKWIQLAIEYDKIMLLPLSIDILLKSVKSDLLNHNDPADRIIAATSLITNSSLITKDKKLRESKAIITIW